MKVPAIREVKLTRGRDALASEINQEHRLAQQTAKTAVAHAVKCGQLLRDVKATLKHGDWNAWVKNNCDFQYSTAARYMKAAKQISTGVEISSLSGLFPSGGKASGIKRIRRKAAQAWDAPAANERLLAAIELEFSKYGAQKEDRHTIVYFLRQHIKGLSDEDTA
jgi:Protein of unknown function (DUF3102)